MTAVKFATRCLVQIALVLATVALFALVTADPSQASSRSSATVSIAPIAHTVSAQQTVWYGTSAVSLIVKGAIKVSPCCAKGLGHCAGSSCAAGYIVASPSVAWDRTPLLWALPLQSSLTSLELDPQFRPPRIAA